MLSFFLFKQKTAYEMRISDWSSDVCSSDLHCMVWTNRGHRYLPFAGSPNINGGLRLDLSLTECVALIVSVVTAGCTAVDTWIRWRERKPTTDRKSVG